VQSSQTTVSTTYTANTDDIADAWLRARILRLSPGLPPDTEPDEVADSIIQTALLSAKALIDKYFCSIQLCTKKGERCSICEECHICREAYSEQGRHCPFMIRRCKHVFGRECLMQWIECQMVNFTCPICWASLFESEDIPVVKSLFGINHEAPVSLLEEDESEETDPLTTVQRLVGDIREDTGLMRHSINSIRAIGALRSGLCGLDDGITIPYESTAANIFAAENAISTGTAEAANLEGIERQAVTSELHLTCMQALEHAENTTHLNLQEYVASAPQPGAIASSLPTVWHEWRSTHLPQHRP